jgi:hypothetical protein
VYSAFANIAIATNAAAGSYSSSNSTTGQGCSSFMGPDSYLRLKLIDYDLFDSLEYLTKICLLGYSIHITNLYVESLI